MPLVGSISYLFYHPAARPSFPHELGDLTGIDQDTGKMDIGLGTTNLWGNYRSICFVLETFQWGKFYML